MTNALTPDAYLGRIAVDPRGNRIGSIGQVYVNDQSGAPDWITVNTGLYGIRENFVPLQGARFDGDDLVLPFERDVVKDAPEVSDASHLEADEQQSLYSYYSQYLIGRVDSSAGAGAGLGDQAAGSDGPGWGTSGSTTEDAMTRSEEQLQVGTQQVQTGGAQGAVELTDDTVRDADETGPQGR